MNLNALQPEIKLKIIHWAFRVLVVIFGILIYWIGSFFYLLPALLFKLAGVAIVFLVEPLSDLIVSFFEPADYNSSKYRHPNFYHSAEEIKKIRSAYYSAIFKVAGYLISKDENFDPAERQYLINLINRLQLDNNERKLASDCLRQGKNPDFNIKKTLDEFQKNCHEQDEMLNSFIEIQFEMAWSDKKISYFQINTLDLICNQLGYKDTFTHLLAEYRLKAQMYESKKQEQTTNKTPKKQQEQITLSYHILGINEGASMRDIKVAYRKLIKAHHPDTLIAQGYPIEMLQQATERSAEINHAYDYLRDNAKHIRHI